MAGPIKRLSLGGKVESNVVPDIVPLSENKPK